MRRIEELVDRSTGETSSELKNAYHQQSNLLHSIGILNRLTPHYDETIEGLVDNVQGIRDQLIEIGDASMHLEDKIDNMTSLDSAVISRRRKASSPSSLSVVSEHSGKPEESDLSPKSTSPASRFPLHLIMADKATRIRFFRERVFSIGAGSQLWTVHVSLLPTSSQPFPFEKDTAAYKHLHQVVVVKDCDSFMDAVDAFWAVLRPPERTFVFGFNFLRKIHVPEAPLEIGLIRLKRNPLVARLCDAKSLQGLSMPRQLDQCLIEVRYDAEFLQQNCAVNNENGKILDLYIATADDTVSWAELRDIAL
ncbi:unnamed protein product [Diplocarpon coronariae]|nr:hypothetical protein JHW43_008478 [Diplocarpon mali]